MLGSIVIVFERNSDSLLAEWVDIEVSITMAIGNPIVTNHHEIILLISESETNSKRRLLDVHTARSHQIYTGKPDGMKEVATLYL